MKEKQNIANSINSISTDVNAEVIIADLMDIGLSFDDLLVAHEGQFKRNYSRDLLSAYFDVVKNILILNVSRDSLYDILPQGLFHHMFSNLNSESRHSELEKLNKEEQSARNFFLPLDNEMFNQYVEIEKELRTFFRNPEKFYRDLLLLHKDVSGKYATKLAAYILFSDKIIGNPELTALLLADFIEEEVDVETHLSEFPIQNENGSSKAMILQDSEVLGSNFICGSSAYEHKKVWEFIITLEELASVENYIKQEKGLFKNLLGLFFDYFIPLEVETKTIVKYKHYTPFRLSNDMTEQSNQEKYLFTENYLGYNTEI